MARLVTQAFLEEAAPRVIRERQATQARQERLASLARSAGCRDIAVRLASREALATLVCQARPERLDRAGR